MKKLLFLILLMGGAAQAEWPHWNVYLDTSCNTSLGVVHSWAGVLSAEANNGAKAYKEVTEGPGSTNVYGACLPTADLLADVYWVDVNNTPMGQRNWLGCPDPQDDTDICYVENPNPVQLGGSLWVYEVDPATGAWKTFPTSVIPGPKSGSWKSPESLYEICNYTGSICRDTHAGKTPRNFDTWFPWDLLMYESHECTMAENPDPNNNSAYTCKMVAF